MANKNLKPSIFNRRQENNYSKKKFRETDGHTDLHFYRVTSLLKNKRKCKVIYLIFKYIFKENLV